MLRASVIVTVWLGMCGCTAVAAGPPPTKPARADGNAIGPLVAALGGTSWAARESAQKRLIEIGEPAVRAIVVAARSADPEVSARSWSILKAIHASREVHVKDLGKFPQPAQEVYPFLSPNGERMAWLVRREGRAVLVCDGKEGPEWDDIQSVGPFLQDGNRLPYQATKNGKAFIVFVGEEDKPLAAPGALRAVYSPDGKRMAYWVQEANQRWVVCDGKEGPRYRDVNLGFFSPDGKRLFYTATDKEGRQFLVVDGQPMKIHAGVSGVVLSPDGNRWAGIAKRDGNRVVVCDGKEGKAYPEVFSSIFSPSGNSLAYYARTADRKTAIIVWDEKEVAQLTAEPQLTFSPDGRRLAWGTYRSGEVYLHDGRALTRLASGNDAASRPVFSPDGEHVACAVGKGMRWRVCVDGNFLRGTYDPENVMHWDGPNSSGSSMILDAPGFSADGRHVFYKGFRGLPGAHPRGNRQHFIVCDGMEGPSHDDLWIPENSRNHAKRLRYVVRDGDRVRLVESAWSGAETWQDALEVLGRDVIVPFG
jgi:Tol biopolymer transport system component